MPERRLGNTPAPGVVRCAPRRTAAAWRVPKPWTKSSVRWARFPAPEGGRGPQFPLQGSGLANRSSLPDSTQSICANIFRGGLSLPAFVEFVVDVQELGAHRGVVEAQP